jgi:apolipoprotein N-acyltransferase
MSIDSVARLRGWRGRLLVFALGMIAALGLPPLGLWPVLFVAVPLLLIRFGFETTWRGGFALGWQFGFGYFLVALHWIGFAFLVDATTYLWMMPFAVGGLAAGMALYWGLAGAVTVWLGQRRLPSFLVFPAALSTCEYLRGHLLTGFPWAVPGLVGGEMGGVAQVAAVTGMTGLTLLVLLWASAPVAFLSRNKVHIAVPSVILVSLPLVWLGGSWREMRHPTQFVDNVLLRIVQPNISQSDKWRAQNAAGIFDQLVRMSTAPSASGKMPTHIIWPESALPFLVDESATARSQIAAMLRPDKTLITGAIRRSVPDPEADYYTSVLVFDSTGKVTGTYDKWRLVPGGEFLPFAWLLEPLGFQRLVALPGSFAAGTGPKSLPVAHAGRAGMIVCYEVIFPNRLIDTTVRPDWIVNVTNDGWFGNSIGPHQHLAQARLRVIEQGLPLVRAANTGVSGVLDPVGRAIAITSLLRATGLDSRLPTRLAPTLYSRFGDSLLFLEIVLTLIAATWFARKLS